MRNFTGLHPAAWPVSRPPPPAETCPLPGAKVRRGVADVSGDPPPRSTYITPVIKPGNGGASSHLAARAGGGGGVAKPGLCHSVSHE